LNARNSITLVCLAAILAGAVLIRLPLLAIPLERDEGSYGYVAWRLLLGEVPYRDVFDHKPPGVFALYALAFSTFGISATGIHLFAALYNSATAGVLFLLVARLRERWTGLVAAAVFAIMSAAPAYHGQAANTEAFLLLPMLGAAALVWRALGRAQGCGLAFVAGVLCGVALLIKQQAAPVALFLALALAWRRIWKERRVRAGVAELALMLAGAVLPAATTLLIFWRLGALGALYDAVIRYNADYARSWSAADSRDMLALVFHTGWCSQGLLWLLAVLGAVILAVRRTRGDVFLLAMFAASAAAVAMGLLLLPHYFVLLLPATAALAACAVSAVGNVRALRQRRRTLIALYCLIAVACGLAAFAGDGWYWFRRSPDEAVRRVYPGNPFDQSSTLAAYLQKQTKPGDRLFIVGSEPQVLLLARRRTVSRYPYIYPLTLGSRAARARQRETLAAIEAAPPVYLVLVLFEHSLLPREGRSMEFSRRLSALIRRDYYLEAFTAPSAQLPAVAQEDQRRFRMIEGRDQLQRYRSILPSKGQVLLFRRRAAGDTFPDVRGDWSFSF